MTLAEQLAHLRQLAITDPDMSILDLDLINTLTELAEALEELRDGDPWRGSKLSSGGSGGASPPLASNLLDPTPAAQVGPAVPTVKGPEGTSAASLPLAGTRGRGPASTPDGLCRTRG